MTIDDLYQIIGIKEAAIFELNKQIKQKDKQIIALQTVDLTKKLPKKKSKKT